MTKKVLFPLMVALASVAAGSMGCNASASANIGEPPKAPEPPKVEPPKPAAPLETAKAPAIKTFGKATVENGEIKIPGKINFEFDKAKIKEDAATKDILGTVAQVMKENPGITKLRIEGHTDDKGGSEHNHKLSQARAEAVADWLTKNGVDKSRIATVGLGEDRPLAPNDNDKNREANRRTEFKIWELEGKPSEAAQKDAGGGGGGATQPTTTAKGAAASPAKK